MIRGIREPRFDCIYILLASGLSTHVHEPHTCYKFSSANKELPADNTNNVPKLSAFPNLCNAPIMP